MSQGQGAESFLASSPGSGFKGLHFLLLRQDLPQHGTSFSLENVWRSSPSAFFLEKLMMRVIFRPAALLMEPFSSARLFFFPLPGSTGVGHRGSRGRSHFYPFLAFPAALASCTQGLACNSADERPSGLIQVSGTYSTTVYLW